MVQILLTFMYLEWKVNKDKFIMDDVEKQAEQYNELFDVHPDFVPDGLKKLISTVEYFDKEIAPTVIKEKLKAVKCIESKI